MAREKKPDTGALDSLLSSVRLICDDEETGAAPATRPPAEKKKKKRREDGGARGDGAGADSTAVAGGVDMDSAVSEVDVTVAEVDVTIAEAGAGVAGGDSTTAKADSTVTEVDVTVSKADSATAEVETAADPIPVLNKMVRGAPPPGERRGAAAHLAETVAVRSPHNYPQY